MNKSSPSTPELREVAPAYAPELDLELPLAPDFCSHPPRLSPLAFLQWCEEMMELTPTHRKSQDRRLAETAWEEFVL
jgi:hypothetical protein